MNLADAAPVPMSEADRFAARADDDPDRPRLVWLVEEEPYAATLAQWVHDHVMGYYSGTSVSQSVWWWQGPGWMELTVGLAHQHTSTSDYARITGLWCGCRVGPCWMPTIFGSICGRRPPREECPYPDLGIGAPSCLTLVWFRSRLG